MNIVVTRAAEGLPRRSFTVAEIRRMVEAGIIAEDENFELIDAEIVPISPKGNQHEVLKAALLETFAGQDPRELRVAVRPQANVQRGSIEKVAADQAVAPSALPAIAITMADLD